MRDQTEGNASAKPIATVATNDTSFDITSSRLYPRQSWCWFEMNRAKAKHACSMPGEQFGKAVRNQERSARPQRLNYL